MHFRLESAHDNIAGLTDLAAKLGQKVGQKVIPQIYSPDEYEQVRALGYRDIIWTLYRTSLDNREILAEVDNMTLYAVTMTREHAETGLARNLAQRGVRTYVHTVNTEREQRYFRELGVDEIYTDWLPAF